MLVFLFCSERSGSNFITSLMGGHSRISGCPPSHLFRLFGSNENNYFPTSDTDNWQNFTTDFIEAVECMIGDWDTSISLESLNQACPNRKISEALAYLYENERRPDEKISFIKENHTYLIVPFILANWPDSLFVQQVRDPRDVVASWIKTPDAKGGVVEAVDIWLADQYGTQKAIARHNIAARVSSVRYEDVIIDTQQTILKLCRHLGLDYEDRMLNYYQDERVRRNAQRIPAWQNLAKPVLSGNSGKYASTLTDVDIRYIELSCYRLMHEFGYDLETDISNLTNEQILDQIKSLKNQTSGNLTAEAGANDISDIRKQRLSLIQRVKSRRPILKSLSTE